MGGGRGVGSTDRDTSNEWRERRRDRGDRSRTVTILTRVLGLDRSRLPFEHFHACEAEGRARKIQFSRGKKSSGVDLSFYLFICFYCVLANVLPSRLIVIVILDSPS